VVSALKGLASYHAHACGLAHLQADALALEHQLLKLAARAVRAEEPLAARAEEPLVARELAAREHLQADL